MFNSTIECIVEDVSGAELIVLLFGSWSTLKNEALTGYSVLITNENLRLTYAQLRALK